MSLVRSNQKNNPGFLRTPNRINVLLSRAQHGMYILGNTNTMDSVPMWHDVMEILRRDGNIDDAFWVSELFDKRDYLTKHSAPAFRQMLHTFARSYCTSTLLCPQGLAQNRMRDQLHISLDTAHQDLEECESLSCEWIGHPSRFLEHRECTILRQGNHTLPKQESQTGEP